MTQSEEAFGFQGNEQKKGIVIPLSKQSNTMIVLVECCMSGMVLG
jgi:hypothetical protein